MRFSHKRLRRYGLPAIIVLIVVLAAGCSQATPTPVSHSSMADSQSMSNGDTMTQHAMDSTMPGMDHSTMPQGSTQPTMDDMPGMSSDMPSYDDSSSASGEHTHGTPAPVGPDPNRNPILIGFGAVNGLVIVSAGILKMRMPKKRRAQATPEMNPVGGIAE